jgi:hypothetical protein
MKISINRLPFTIDVEIQVQSNNSYQISHLEIPKLTDGKIELKEFYKFLMDLETVLNKSINQLEVADYEA